MRRRSAWAASGPLLGGVLGEVSWRGPFFGVAVLMAIALIATVVLVEKTPRPPRKTSLSAPLRALRHRGLLILSLTALCYNWGFFIGVNNTVTTQAVMTVSPVERPVASAAYSFVRFIGGGLAPTWPAGWSSPRASTSRSSSPSA